MFIRFSIVLGVLNIDQIKTAPIKSKTAIVEKMGVYPTCCTTQPILQVKRNPPAKDKKPVSPLAVATVRFGNKSAGNVSNVAEIH